MTVSTELSHEEYIGNGVTTDFDFRFRIFEGKHLIVVVADSDGNEKTLKNGTDYTIVGAGSYHGGKVVLNKPLAQGWKILLERDLPVVQETDLRNQGKFFAEVHEDAFDYLTMLIQKALGTFSLSLRKPTYLSNYYDAKDNRIANLAPPKLGSDSANKDYVDNSIKDIDSKTLRVKDKPIPALPSAEQRRNKQLGFDNEGYPQLLDPAETGSLGYVLVDSFEKGAEITTRYQALHFENNGEYYRWDGELPKYVSLNSTPEDSGGIGSGKWLSIGDASLRSALSSNDGASLIGTEYGINLSALIKGTSTGVSLSRMMKENNPLEKSLLLSRELGVELVIDCDCDYEYLLLKTNDKIRCVGYPTLTKINNNTPTIEPSQAPERPLGTKDNFNKNAFFIVYHEDNKTAERISFTGGVSFRAGSDISLDCYAYIPRISFSEITNIRADSGYFSESLDGFVFHDEYACTIGDIHVLNSGMARRGFVWEDILAGISYNTGTSGNLYGLHTVKFRYPFKFNRHQYSEVRVSGGEMVGEKDEINKPTPLVFDIVDSNIVLISPSSEHLYGGFVHTKRTNSTMPSSCSVIGGQLNTAIFGSRDDIDCKMFYADGGTLTIDGGFYTSAAIGYYLKFGGAMNDGSIDVRNLDGNFILNSIKSDPNNYTGFHKINLRANKYLLKVSKLKENMSNSGVIPLSNVEYDPFGMHLNGSSAIIKRTGFYKVYGSVRTLNASGYLIIKIAGSERARTYFDVTGVSTSNTQSHIQFEGRINAGSECAIEVVLNSGVVRGQDWYDCKMSIELY
ncbi:hypothetical protein [Proteus mirabilis]|uniref:tail fiber/spike domain-containing protein n=1 Tax=Proteus mirabilis TaxID=584 RepID=UPI001C76AAF5|nr:hypothetical protein [Proteus mirabilis]QXL77886.1 hypothetical protein KPK64_02116 [Proteus mirabilis]